MQNTITDERIDQRQVDEGPPDRWVFDENTRTITEIDCTVPRCRRRINEREAVTFDW